MKTPNLIRGTVAAIIAAGTPLGLAHAEAPATAATVDSTTALGAVVGVVSDVAGHRVGGATLTATRADGSGVRAAIAGSDGVFSFADLPPGVWSLSVQAKGYADTKLPSVTVLPLKAMRSDIVLKLSGNGDGAGMYGGTAVPETAAPGTAAPGTLKGLTSQFVRAIAYATVPDSVLAQNTAPAGTQNVPAGSQGSDQPKVDTNTPFAYGDFTWLNGNPRNSAPAFDTPFFTPDIRVDAEYMQDFNGPQDHTIVGSTESFRTGEFQLEQVSVGGDFHWENVRARILYMDGLFSTTTPRNDASSAVGQWDLPDAYRYLSEANAGYHFDVNHGLNVDAGIFVSYIGLFSYYNYDNWTYQPSYVSSNTPWFFNGMRIQWFPTNTLKIEPWIINGWQSYARFNGHLGYGGQILWRPQEWLDLVFNNYGVGTDNLGLPRTTRIHTDDSIEVRYFNKPGAPGVSKMALSLTLDAGCQHGGGITCTSGNQKSSFLGAMMYNRIWFDRDLFAVTVGGGMMNNPGRYLTLLPPINGATAATGTPYFTENPGQHAYMWDSTVNLQYMPKQWITWWGEFGFRHSDIPYFAGAGGVTPPGGNNGEPQDYTCNSGATAGTNVLSQALGACGASGVWYPDLRKRQATLSAGLLVKF
jgi:Putative beta-barrel porin-2, OmpL-like. bbp2/Carboxypeptidase regulatory-like domain